MISHTLNCDGLPVVGWQAAEEEAERARWRRRIQQRRCLVCGSPQLLNRLTSYFCADHFPTHRWCYVCETLRNAESHGRDGGGRCRPCAAVRALGQYHAAPDANLYRNRLRGMARRQSTRAEQIFAGMRWRIALAALVAATPGLSWRARGRLIGRSGENMARVYRAQCRGENRDRDAIDVARDAYWRDR
jgi:hypothetical protein